MVMLPSMLPDTLHIGPIPIHWFGIFLALALLVAGMVLSREFRRAGLSADHGWEAVVWGAIGGLMGARLWVIGEQWGAFIESPLRFAFSSGGLAWYGGLAGGTLAVTIYFRRHAIPWLTGADAVAPALAIGQAVGRMGCQVSGDGDWGIETTLPWGMAYPHAVVGWDKPPGVLVHPTPIYEFLAYTAVFFFLLRVRGRTLVPGVSFGSYLALAGFARFLVEFVRINPRVALGLTLAQMVSALLVVVGLWLVARARKQSVPAMAAWLPLLMVVAMFTSGCGDPSGRIHASGIIEMDEIDVGSLVGGRISRLLVDEGDQVRAGDTLAVLDRDEIAAEFEVQTAQAQRAAAQSREVAIGPRAQEIRVARAQLASAQSQLDLAETDLERTESLFKSQVSSRAELDRARAVRDDAMARRDAARERLAQLEAGSRHEEIVAAREAATAARAAVVAARSRLRELVLTAPVSGVVLLRNFEPGELAGPNQPVVTLGNSDSLWLRVYVAAPDLARIKRGAAAEVHLTGVRQSFPGRVVEIGTRAEFTPRAALTEEERASIVFPVKIELAPSNGILKAGLPADARIEAVPR